MGHGRDTHCARSVTMLLFGFGFWNRLAPKPSGQFHMMMSSRFTVSGDAALPLTAFLHPLGTARWHLSTSFIGWGVDQDLIPASPFRHRQVWRRGSGGRRSAHAERNMAYEPSAASSQPRFASLETYRQFNRIGLRGLTPTGHERPGARDRNGMRNALFADLLVSTRPTARRGRLSACLRSRW